MSDSQNNLSSPFSVEWTHQLFNTDSAFSSDDALTQVCDSLAPVKLLPIIDEGVFTNHSSLTKIIQEWETSTNVN